MASLFDPNRIRLIQAIMPIIESKDEYFEQRYEVEYYVNLCQIAGFCDTDDMMQQCARRYLEGKRKVSPPGTRRRKEDKKKKQKLYANLPTELLSIIEDTVKLPMADQYRKGNEKALNALVGNVLKQYKFDPAVVKELLISKI